MVNVELSAHITNEHFVEFKKAILNEMPRDIHFSYSCVDAQPAHRGVDGRLKVPVFLGQGRQGIQLIHRLKHTAAETQPQRGGQPRQQQTLSHRLSPLPACSQLEGIISQISRSAYGFFVNAKIFWADARPAGSERVPPQSDIFSVSLDAAPAFVLK